MVECSGEKGVHKVMGHMLTLCLERSIGNSQEGMGSLQASSQLWATKG